jgi:protein-S-isoprenylcysteine O-methyltransferase Ste14
MAPKIDGVRTFPRAAATMYAAIAYLSFIAATLWAVGFLADAGSLVPTIVDGPLRGGPVEAIVINAALLLLFAVQHTVMARAGFKRRLKALLPARVERATYVLATSLVFGLLFGLWRPVDTPIWHVTAPAAVVLIWVLCGLGWLVAIASTFMIDHFDFLGLRQAQWRSTSPYEPPPFRERWFYAWMRHPMMLGLLVAFWATPRMTGGHLLFASAASAYIAVGLRFEERDLRRQLGPVYADYAARVPAVVPVGRRSAAPARRPEKKAV